MVFLYAVTRALASFWRMLAAWKHGRLKRTYERLQSQFQELEGDCKAHEVRVGRPADYTAQLRLLKAYERQENARQRWVAAATALKNWQRRESLLKELTGKKLPYSFGLVDMALLLHVLDHLGLPFKLDLPTIYQFVQARL